MSTPFWGLKPRGDVVTVCCGREPRITVQLSVQIPLEMYRRVTKRKLRRADVEVEAANWERAIWQCPGCHRVWAPGVPPEVKG